MININKRLQYFLATNDKNEIFEDIVYNLGKANV